MCELKQLSHNQATSYETLNHLILFEMESTQYLSGGRCTSIRDSAPLIMAWTVSRWDGNNWLLIDSKYLSQTKCHVPIHRNKSCKCTFSVLTTRASLKLCGSKHFHQQYTNEIEVSSLDTVQYLDKHICMVLHLQEPAITVFHIFRINFLMNYIKKCAVMPQI